jgi:hypothetical protein
VLFGYKSCYFGIICCCCCCNVASTVLYWHTAIRPVLWCSPVHRLLLPLLCYWLNNKNKTLLLPLLCYWLNKNKNAYAHKNESINATYKFIVQRSISHKCTNKLKILKVHTNLIICPYYYSPPITLLTGKLLAIYWHSYFDPHLGICTISSTGRQLQEWHIVFIKITYVKVCIFHCTFSHKTMDVHACKYYLALLCIGWLGRSNKILHIIFKTQTRTLDNIVKRWMCITEYLLFSHLVLAS